MTNNKNNTSNPQNKSINKQPRKQNQISTIEQTSYCQNQQQTHKPNQSQQTTVIKIKITTTNK